MELFRLKKPRTKCVVQIFVIDGFLGFFIENPVECREAYENVDDCLENGPVADPHGDKV